MNNLIDISIIESGETNVFIEIYDIKYKLEYIFIFFEKEAEQKGLQLKMINEFHNNESHIKTDPQKLNAILINLVKNAIKFTKKGIVEFGCEWKEDHYLFYVRDTGAGIDPQMHEIIFDRFRQASESLSRPYEGAGLGLSISKVFVEMLGGRIWVESEEEKGSVFYFTIPHQAKPFKKILDERNGSNTDLSIINIPLVSQLKILIAEDDENSKILLSILTKDYSRELLQAANGIKAVEICRNNPDIDLILMDINMPEMGGYEATRQIRQFNQEVVIISQTAYGLLGDREKSIQAGCNDHISKPIKPANLKALIMRYFN